MAAGRPRFDAMTTWRFVAGFHLVIFHEVIRQGVQFSQPLQNIIDAAFMQVTYFFLVSGFVFGMHYGGAVEKGTLHLRNFWLGRLSRLYPVYILSLLLALPFYLRDLSLANHGLKGALVPLGEQLVAKLLLIQAWFPKTATDWNPPSWAMSAVAFFYLTFPFFAKRIVQAPIKKAITFGVIAFVLSLIPALIYCATAPQGWVGNAFQNQTAWTVFCRLNPAIRLPEFLTGLVLARLYKAGAFENITKTGCRVLVWGGILGILAFAAGSSYIPYMLLHHTLPILPYSALIVGMIAAETHGGMGVLAKPFPVMLGNASFSMYILHVPLFLVTSYVAQKLFGTDRGIAIALVNLVMAVGIAQLGVRYLEGPSRKWMNSVLRVGEAR